MNAATTLLVLFAALLLSACVGSHKQLLTGSNLLGDAFELSLFEDPISGKFAKRDMAVFHWSGARYELASGTLDVKFVRVESLGPNDLLVEGTDDMDYMYFLARKIADATYRFVPVNKDNLGKAVQKRLCVKLDDVCIVDARAALDAFVRASIGKTGPGAMVAVISAPATEAAH
jgi:hypothetical protein